VGCHKSGRDADAGGCHLDGSDRSSLLGGASGHNGHIRQFPNVLRERNALVPGTSSRVYDLRLGQLRSLPASPQPGAVASSQIKELVSLQIAHYADTRMVLAKHLTWNFTRGAFGSQTSRLGLMVAPSIAGISITDTAHLHASGPRVSSAKSIAGSGRVTQPAANAH
jgi:hypothetical protein